MCLHLLSVRWSITIPAQICKYPQCEVWSACPVLPKKSAHLFMDKLSERCLICFWPVGVCSRIDRNSCCLYLWISRHLATGLELQLWSYYCQAFKNLRQISKILKKIHNWLNTPESDLILWRQVIWFFKIIILL